MRILRAVVPIALLCCLDARAESLREYYALVQQSDPRLGIAASTIDVAEDQRRQAAADLLPHVAVQAGVNQTRRSTLSGLFQDTSGYDSARYSVSVDQPLLNLPRYNSLQQARELVHQAQFDSQDQESQVRLDAVERYLGALAAVDTLELARQEEQNSQVQLERVRALQARQLAKITDLLTVEARVDQLRAVRLKAEGELKIATDLLSELVAHPVQSLLTLDPARRLPPVTGRVEDWEGQGEDVAPAVKAQQVAVERAQLEVDRRRWMRAPVVTLQLSGQQSNIGYDNALSPDTRTGVISLNVTVPLYSGGSVSAAVGEARSRERIAELNLDATRRTQKSRTRAVFFQLESLRAQTEATSRAVLSTQRSLEAAERGFELGVITVSEFLDARRDLYSARRDAMSARLEYLHQWAKLHHLTGTLDNSVMTQISDLLTVGVAPAS